MADKTKLAVTIAWLDKAVKRSQKRAGNVAKGEKDFLHSHDLKTGAFNTASVGKVLSDSIWIDGDRLIDDVRAELFKCYQTGKSLDELRQKLIRQVKPTPGTNIADRMAQAESKVDRLISSESAKMIDEIDTSAYKKAGVEYVNWVIEPGACSKCVSLKESGPYPIDKAPALVIDSHPNCRCAKVPSDKADLRGLGLVAGAALAHLAQSNSADPDDSHLEYQHSRSDSSDKERVILDSSTSQKYNDGEDEYLANLDARVVKYFSGEISESLSERQKVLAVEAYFNFKKDGIIFTDHGIARYVERMRRKNGSLIYNYVTVKKAFANPPNYVSEKDGRDARYYKNILYVSEPDTGVVVTMMKRTSIKGFKKK